MLFREFVYLSAVAEHHLAESLEVSHLSNASSQTSSLIADFIRNMFTQAQSNLYDTTTYSLTSFSPNDTHHMHKRQVDSFANVKSFAVSHRDESWTLMHEFDSLVLRIEKTTGAFVESHIIRNIHHVWSIFRNLMHRMNLAIKVKSLLIDDNQVGHFTVFPENNWLDRHC